MFLIVVSISSLQLAINLMSYYDGKLVSNLMKLYAVAGDLYNIVYLLHVSLQSTVLWNNTLNYYGKEGSRAMFE